MSRILLDHGEGGAATSRLVHNLFLRHLGAPATLEDAAVLPGAGRLAFTTDSFVVRPARFPGGDIGRLAVCGTVNDLAVMGAEPRYLSAGFILEEGLEMELLEQIVISMAATAREAGVSVVTGDTKVVGRGEADGIYINTSGVGFVPGPIRYFSTVRNGHARRGREPAATARWVTGERPLRRDQGAWEQSAHSKPESLPY